MANKQKRRGPCRICGKVSDLTEEHILPRAAGGNRKTKIYSGTEMLKTLRKDSTDKPYGKIRQNGHTEYTLCSSCNNHSGLVYDKDFANFYNIFNQQVVDLAIKSNVPDTLSLMKYMQDKGIVITIEGLKPMNIAKRILVAFCSVEFEGLTDRIPEIRKAIMEKDYPPDTSAFSLYLTAHVGNESFYARMASSFMKGDGGYGTQAFAGIETDFIGFYLADHNEHLKGGALAGCVDITNWLTDCEYDQVGSVEIHTTFKKSLMIDFPTDKLTT